MNVAQSSFDRTEDYVQTQIDQIDSGKRNNQAAANHNARIQHVIENIEDADLVGHVAAGHDHVAVPAGKIVFTGAAIRDRVAASV